MRRSTNGIIVSHAGTLPRPDDLQALFAAGAAAADDYRRRVPSAVREIVRKQVDLGFSIVNDGEFGKPDGFTNYPRRRLSNLEVRHFEAGEGPRRRDVQGRDRRAFPGFAAQGFPARMGGASGLGAIPGEGPRDVVYCTGPVSYIGTEAVQEDIDNLKAALDGLDAEGYLPAVAVGTMEHWLYNDYYKTDEEFLYAIAECMREEYKQIVESGLVLQIDDPDLPDGWQMFPEMSVEEYRKYAELRIEALNHALRDLPEDRIRFHTCWGSQHGPHRDDIELSDIVDLILKVRAECYSVEAANPRHDTDYHVWESVKLPEDKTYMPGVVSHVSNHIEHPRLVAERLQKYASLMGRENVIAGTDCGMGTRVGHAEVCWAKFEAMVEGARLATQALWS